jgi:hypothetical protein
MPLVRKGVATNERPPPSSAIAKQGNLWGRSEYYKVLIGKAAHRLCRGGRSFVTTPFRTIKRRSSRSGPGGK